MADQATMLPAPLRAWVDAQGEAERVSWRRFTRAGLRFLDVRLADGRLQIFVDWEGVGSECLTLADIRTAPGLYQTRHVSLWFEGKVLSPAYLALGRRAVQQLGDLAFDEVVRRFGLDPSPMPAVPFLDPARPPAAWSAVRQAARAFPGVVALWAGDPSEAALDALVEDAREREPDLVVVGVPEGVGWAAVPAGRIRDALKVPASLLEVPRTEPRGLVSRFVSRIAALVPLDPGPTDPARLVLLGLPREGQVFFKDRVPSYLARMYRMVLGLRLIGAWPDGRPALRMAAAGRAGLIVTYPGAQEAGALLAQRTGAVHAPVDFPMGIDGAERVLHQVALAAGLDVPVAERLADLYGPARRMLDHVQEIARTCVLPPGTSLPPVPPAFGGRGTLRVEMESLGHRLTAAGVSFPSPLQWPQPADPFLRGGSDTLIFVPSSQRCSLDCAYCVRHGERAGPSLGAADLDAILDLAGRGRTVLGLSGTGDFFAGYGAKERVLEHLLARPGVKVILDINGMTLHELPELSPDQRRRIRFVNLTLHYPEVRDHGFRDRWARNAEAVIRAVEPEGWVLVNTVITRDAPELWEDAIEWYRGTVFAATGARLALLTDQRKRLNPGEAAVMLRLANLHADVVSGVTEEDWASAYPPDARVWCAAGHRAFMALPSGPIVGCPFAATPDAVGDWREGRFRPRPGPRLCTAPRQFECATLGVGGYLHWDEEGRQPALPALPPMYRREPLRSRGG